MILEFFWYYKNLLGININRLEYKCIIVSEWRGQCKVYFCLDTVLRKELESTKKNLLSVFLNFLYRRNLFGLSNQNLEDKYITVPKEARW